MEWKLASLDEYFPIYEYHESSYFNYHWSFLYDCVQHGLYASAYPHLHLLYMLFVYTQLLRISKERQADFRLCTTGYRRRDGSDFTTVKSPHEFTDIPEKAVFRLFRIVGFDDSTIRRFFSVIDKRNAYLHATGSRHTNNPNKFEKRIDTYLRHMKAIVGGQRPLLEKIYSELITPYENGEADIDLQEIVNNFSNKENFLSTYEMLLLAEGKDDSVSRFIRSEFGDGWSMWGDVAAATA